MSEVKWTESFEMQQKKIQWKKCIRSIATLIEDDDDDHKQKKKRTSEARPKWRLRQFKFISLVRFQINWDVFRRNETLEVEKESE